MPDIFHETVSGRVLVQHMWDELEKISKVSTEMGLKPKPYELGIESGRSGKENKRIATISGLGGAALAGALAGGQVGAVTGGAPAMLAVTKKGRRQIASQLSKDLSKVRGAARRGAIHGVSAMPKAYTAKVKERTFKQKKVLPHQLLWTAYYEAPRAAHRAARAHAAGEAAASLGDVMKRRGKGALRGAALGAAAAGGIKALSNRASYEVGREATKRDRADRSRS